MRLLPALALVASLAALNAQDAAAQSRPNVGGDPVFGTMRLSAGFSPDPSTREVAAGGSDRYSQGDCTGYINNAAPDIDFYYEAGSLPLTLSAASASDIILVVNTPDGRWLCDDDSAGNLNAKLTFSRPRSGLYNIWIGTARATSDRPTALFGVSEVGTTVQE